MSAQTMADTMAPWEAHYHAKVIEATWGHLAPKKNRTYKGFLIFAVGCFGDDRLNPTALAIEFKGLDSSPWFYDSLQDFMGDQKTEEGCVYRFDGTFRNYEFAGTIQRLRLVK